MQVTRVFCDKCGAEIKESHKLMVSRYSEQIRGQWQAENARLKGADFCGECVKQIIDYAFQKDESKKEAMDQPLPNNEQEVEWSIAIERLRANHP